MEFGLLQRPRVVALTLLDLSSAFDTDRSFSLATVVLWNLSLILLSAEPLWGEGGLP